ncbi:hypothetical protein F2Q69_00047514 [Brassica cretica]|uniref:Uncharacterized protein n=1 Tax=Brassica cretica TaxID=69181 RepID=A0A8S9PFS7_BRACR|nr:hypothetical protein F2Q69_00047514 [Brassica cretica]
MLYHLRDFWNDGWMCLFFYEKLKIVVKAHLVVAWIISPIREKMDKICLLGTVEAECMSLKVFVCFVVVDVKVWSNSSLIVVVMNEGRQRLDLVGLVVDLNREMQDVYCVRIKEGIKTPLTF